MAIFRIEPDVTISANRPSNTGSAGSRLCGSRCMHGNKRSIRVYRAKIQHVGFWRHRGGVRDERCRLRSNADGGHGRRHVKAPFGSPRPRYSSASCFPAELASASPGETILPQLHQPDKDFGRHRHALKIPRPRLASTKPTITLDAPFLDSIDDPVHAVVAEGSRVKSRLTSPRRRYSHDNQCGHWLGTMNHRSDSLTGDVMSRNPLIKIGVW